MLKFGGRQRPGQMTQDMSDSEEDTITLAGMEFMTWSGVCALVFIHPTFAQSSLHAMHSVLAASSIRTRKIIDSDG